MSGGQLGGIKQKRYAGRRMLCLLGAPPTPTSCSTPQKKETHHVAGVRKTWWEWSPFLRGGQEEENESANDYVRNVLEANQAGETWPKLKEFMGVIKSVAKTSLDVLEYAYLVGAAAHLLNDLCELYEQSGDNDEGVKNLVELITPLEKQLAALDGTRYEADAKKITVQVLEAFEFCNRYLKRGGCLKCIRAHELHKELEGWQNRIRDLKVDLVHSIQFSKASLYQRSKSGGPMQLAGQRQDYVGLEEKVEEVKKLLLEPGEGGESARAVTVIAVRGMGGIGKSTLAAAVYDDSQIREHFEGAVCWVDVAKDASDEDKVKKQGFIFDKLTKALESDGPQRVAMTNPFADVANSSQGRNKLRQLLATRQVFVVLDNVWSEKDQPIKVEDLSPGSRLLITTRQSAVVRTNSGLSYELECLNHNDSRTLLTTRAFQIDESPPEKVGVSVEKVLKWCGGLPLALTVAGQAAKEGGRAREAEWWEGFVASMEQQNFGGTEGESVNKELYAVLRASYDCASATAREAFVVLAAMCPEDLKKGWPWWSAICSGGDATLKELEDRSLLKWEQRAKASAYGTLSIHDHLRQIASHIATTNRDAFYRCWSGHLGATCTTAIPLSTRHLSVKDSNLTTLPWHLLSSTRLQTVFLTGNKSLADLGTSPIDAVAISICGSPHLEMVPLARTSNRLRLLDISNVQGLHFSYEDDPDLMDVLAPLSCFDAMETLSLRECSLMCSFPLWIGKLIQLRELDLTSNLLTDSIPPQLGLLTRLEDLRLSKNTLTGPIPSALGELQKLRVLYLDGNNLEGSIPPELGSLTNLEHLHLFDNALTGPIPSTLGHLSNLRVLYLYNNYLEGSIPPELGSLAGLEHLQLSRNRLAGSIPPTLGKLLKLRVLYLDDNQLDGSIPPELGSLTGLEDLQLSENRLTGPIPSSLGQLSKLRLLYLRDNRLEGEIPSQLGSLTGLEDLRLFKNRLTGAIPGALGSLSKLRVLYLDDNQLQGNVPAELGSLTGLEDLRLSENRLTGAIPSALGRLSKLRFLYLDRNRLEGSIPCEFGLLKELEELYLDENDVCGTVPGEVASLPQLRVWSMEGCHHISGLPNLRHLTSLELLDLSDCSGLVDLPELPPMVDCHLGVECDVCEVSPIIGARYSCVTEEDFNLCPNCYSEVDDKETYEDLHSFMPRVTLPKHLASSP